MAIVIRSGLLAAVAYVQAFFAASSVSAVVEVGWRRRAQQLNQGPGGANRVIFLPSDDGGDGGELGPVRFPGPRNVRSAADAPPVATVRSLADWQRVCLVSVWAADGAHPTDEGAQIEAVEDLFEWTVRAVHSAPGAFAEASFGKVRWTPPTERSFGLELLTRLTFKQPVFDQPREFVYPAAAAVARGTYTPPIAPSSDGDT